MVIGMYILQWYTHWKIINVNDVVSFEYTKANEPDALSEEENLQLQEIDSLLEKYSKEDKDSESKYPTVIFQLIDFFVTVAFYRRQIISSFSQ
jgi:hypothetical protein